MKVSRPIIGITCGYEFEKEMSFVKNGYYDAVNKCGGLAFLIPVTSDVNMLDGYFNALDGFLLSGGPDADARCYNEQNLPCNGEISPHRDTMEIYIAKKAIEYNKPIMGICRGMQMINIAMGGTLYQDIGCQIKDRDALKHSQSAPKWYPTHEIYIEKDSLVYSSFNRDCAAVNSFHHQAVKDVAPGFKVTSRSADGIIESIEHKNQKFAVGVQWHPETMWRENAEFLKLFESFVNYCRGIG